MSTQSSPILSVLTEDLLIRVNEKLVQDSDRKIWRLICKEFHRVDSITRKTLRVLHVEFLPTLLKNYTNLHTLDLSVCPCIEDGTITLLLHRVDHSMWARNLKFLNLRRANGLKFAGLEMLVGACKGLESLDVSYCCGFGDREAAAISGCGGLKELRMDKCLGVSDVGLAKIVVGCGRLVRLSLKWCMEISDLGVELLCKKCLELKFLDVSYLKVTSDSLRSIAALPKLEDLAMVGCPLVNVVGLQFLENGCPLLQKIDVSRCDCVSSSGLSALIRGHNGLLQIDARYTISEFSANFVECMQELKNLNAIIIDGARVSDTVFQTISYKCRSLIEIGLSKCTGVTNMGIMQLVSGCVNLKTINLTCCRSITDAAISAIADSCRNLLCLKLESCNMITEKSLKQLGSHCTLLEELDLTDCFGINDRGLERLSRCSRLLCLKLGLCTNISDTGLFYIASNCSQLHELDLYRCMGIGDDGLAALSSGCKKLRKLNLSYCIEVTDKGMESLGYLEELSDLELRGLDKITGVGLTALVIRCKRLAYLDLKHCGKVDDTGFWALAYHSRNLRQINLSYCSITDMALCMVMGNLTRLQDADLVHLRNVTVEGFDLALRACCVRIKKVKLVAALGFLLSSEVLGILHARGCRIRWD
ncbi:F-box/LRR-repeat protein 3 isoform X1 [Populus alba]|uniref:F-box/LRR-repeat protein 3-like isoform X1 n=2 Tax=Populus TaxID=3689 RepID=A0A4U5Q3V6_POPAL|nr:F-box/LRR-repeat protein 3-like isoform X1 [Populus alba]KAJ6974237.1 F-box/LRR-repeat protein 3-like isoform X1 [Populus alba x Populus x berolinensis]TKS04272.1 F-box/LRR-repeat protein 3-like isoform X1 [Populus alba]